MKKTQEVNKVIFIIDNYLKELFESIRFPFKETDIGLTGGKNHQIYLNGEKHHILRDGNMIEHLVDLCEKKQKEMSVKY